jgi:2-dehydro-3-deoxyphosphogluconate aldolase / (4S)-4-hydroxy-2-oxoglutarate aldolase
MSCSVLDQLGASVLVPVIVIDDAACADGLGAALVAGGLPVAEVTLRTDAAVDSIARLAARGDVLVGAGTVLTVDQVDAAVAAGAAYIVSPGTSRHVIERAHEHGILALPGAVTATEIQTALEAGVTTVKFFPAAACGGAAALAALAAPFADVRFVPTGGIGPGNLHEYLATPAVLAVGGSWMVPRKLIAQASFDAVRDHVRAASDLAAVLRPNLRTGSRVETDAPCQS